MNDGGSESQLSLITSMQTEIATLKKKLSKFSDNDSDVGSRDSSPVKFFLGSDEKSHVEKALLDKEEEILKLTREIESLKASLTSLSSEDNTRIETQLELTSLKEELMNLQNALEKQEDMISDKETSIGYLKLDLIDKEEKLSTALETLCDRDNAVYIYNGTACRVASHFHGNINQLLVDIHFVFFFYPEYSDIISPSILFVGIGIENTRTFSSNWGLMCVLELSQAPKPQKLDRSHIEKDRS